MWPVMHDLGLSGLHGLRADALFASGLQRDDEPGAAQVQQAIAAAIRAFGRSGCAGRVAQEFGDHPETAVIRMRWACAVAGAAFADSANESGPLAQARRMLLVRPRLPAEQASRPSGGGPRDPAVFLAGRAVT
jgi:hypothetical protein